eukprot:TRINITY_DN2556_c0_g1_i4.p1 TRINITY_DN2556_c0_g1~~TRINITY_DN2556_c0_g1_i4.p1  ORF type:complete len:319 (+),score=46.26 TRINITY_DN2556_c0_g1_i4:987-1943(+)
MRVGYVKVQVLELPQFKKLFPETHPTLSFGMAEKLCPLAQGHTIHLRNKNGTWVQFAAVQSMRDLPLQSTLADPTSHYSGDSFPVKASHGVGSPAGTSTTLHNVIQNISGQELLVDVVEILPWTLQPRLSSMTVWIDGIETKLSSIASIIFRPATSVDEPGLLQTTFNMSRNQRIHINFEVEKVFLHIEDFPPDSHRGIVIPPSQIIWSTLKSSDQNDDARDMILRPSGSLFTEPILIRHATPDFSMPYNVLALTGTIFALYFGSLVNISIRLSDSTNSRTHPIMRIIIKLGLWPSGTSETTQTASSTPSTANSEPVH